MKSILIAALVVAVAMPALAGDWRPGPKSRYGVPSADAFDPNLREHARMHEGLKNGDTMREDLKGVTVNQSIIGCVINNTQTQNYDNSDGNKNPVTATNTCTNTGNLTGTLSGSFTIKQ